MATQPVQTLRLSRRRFLAAALCAPALIRPGRVFAASEARSLTLRHARTGERFDGVYSENGGYLPDAADALDRLLRDYSADESIVMDVRLFDALSALQAEIGGETLYVTSGYRTERTNRRLRARGEGAARNSLHVQGMAADIYARTVSTSQLERKALALGVGGVGGYRAAGFVHVDVGAVRHWKG